MIDITSKTELMIAAEKGDINKIQHLIKAGANFRIKDINDDTVLSIAAKNGHIKIIDYINSLNQK